MMMMMMMVLVVGSGGLAIPFGGFISFPLQVRQQDLLATSV